MKRLLMIITVGLIGALAAVKVGMKKEPLQFIPETENKNFGAFPPEIPDEQFDDLFI